MIDPLWQDSVWEPEDDISWNDLTQAAQSIVNYGKARIPMVNDGYTHIALNFWNESSLVQTLMYDKIHRFDNLDKKFIQSMRAIHHPTKEGKMAIHIRVDRQQWFDVQYQNSTPALFEPPSQDKLSPQLEYLHRKLRRSKKIGYLGQVTTHDGKKVETKFYGVSKYLEMFTDERLKWKESNSMYTKATGTPVVCITPPYQFGASPFDIGKANLVK